VTTGRGERIVPVIPRSFLPPPLEIHVSHDFPLKFVAQPAASRVIEKLTPKYKSYKEVTAG
jgi:hypothetical protein